MQARNDGATVGQRETQITIALSKLGVAIEHADKATQSLCSRIEAILAPFPPGVESPNKEPKSVVQLAGVLLEMTQHVQRVIDFIETMEHRVEL